MEQREHFQEDVIHVLSLRGKKKESSPRGHVGERHIYGEGTALVWVNSDPPMSYLDVSPLIQCFTASLWAEQQWLEKKFISESLTLLRPYNQKINKPQIPNLSCGRC